MKKALLSASILFSIPCLAQQQQPEVWYFGYNAGVDFSSGSPVSFNGSALSQWEGVATACDTAGNVEFYSDGQTVFNSNNQVMANGTGLMGDPSSTHSATIVPMPGNPDKYYLFTCPELNSSGGFRYSIVDMTLNGGLGDVTATKNVLLQDSTTEQCVVIPKSDGCVWMVTRKYEPVWYAFPIDTGGIQAPVISNEGSVFNKSDANGVGYMKASPLNNKIAIANYGYSSFNSFFEVYDFNDTTGVVSNSFQLSVNSSVYGCSFSPDGTRLYGPEWGPNIYQFDLTAGTVTDIQNSKTVIGNAGGFNAVGDLQIGPDQKIYCSINDGSYLAVINDPNALGTDCDFLLNGVFLGGHTSGIGLPSTLIFGNCGGSASQIVIGSSDTSLCQKFCIDFFDSSTNNPTSWLWQFPGGSPPTSTDQNPTSICYNAPGEYNVTLITTNSSGSDTLTLLNYVTVFATPPFPSITQDGYVLTSSAATTYQWQLNSEDIPGATDQSYEVTQTGFYTVIISNENGCVNSTTLYVEITGMDELSDANVSIYPNPSDGNFTVQLANESAGNEVSIEVINALGQIVYSSSQKNISSLNQKQEIDLSRLPTGVYYLTIQTENYSFNKKIILHH